MSRQISAELAQGFEQSDMPANQRTAEGRILRSGLEQADMLRIPEGAAGVAVLVIDGTGLQIGGAWKPKGGRWTIEPTIKVAVREGRVQDVSFLTRVTW